MPNHENAPTQLVVLGRGLKPDGSPTADTLSLGEFTGRYCADNPAVTDVSFTGGRPALVTELGAPEHGEADHMEAEAYKLGMSDDVHTTTDNNSYTTIQNFVNLARGGSDGEQLVDRTKRTLLVATSAHMKRAMWCAGLVFPDMEFVPADVPPVNSKVSLGEKAVEAALFGVGVALFAGVKPGDVDTIARRDEWFVRQVTRLSAAKNLARILHPATNKQAQI